MRAESIYHNFPKGDPYRAGVINNMGNLSVSEREYEDAIEYYECADKMFASLYPNEKHIDRIIP